MLFDLPLDQLETYRPPRSEPGDFDAFWAETLAAARAFPVAATFARLDAGLSLIDVDDVTFCGYGGQPIRGWFLRPRGATGPLPCVVEFIGYGGGRGHPHDWLLFAAAGYAHFVMDTRGQGSAWRRGDTADAEPDGGNPQLPGFMTRGVLNPATYYLSLIHILALSSSSLLSLALSSSPLSLALSSSLLSLALSSSSPLSLALSSSVARNWPEAIT